MTVTTLALAEQAGVTLRQADHWTRQGLLVTEGAVVPGRARQYHESQVRVARVLGRLRFMFEHIDLAELANVVEAGGHVFDPIEGVALDLDALAAEA